jgi:sporulation protein YlmC with PRC-barrel domain
MLKLTDIISKPVVSIFECKHIGIIENVLFDKSKKNVEFLIIYNEKDDIEYAINPKSIINFDNYFLIKNTSVLCLKSDLDLQLNNFENLINKNVVNVNGESLGNVKEILIDQKFKLNSIETTKNLIISVNHILKIEDIVLYSQNKINIQKYKTKITFKNNEIEVPILVQDIKPKLPIKATINEKLLLNRVVYNNIYNGSETIIKSNSIITNSVIETAKKYGKLKELVKYSF